VPGAGFATVVAAARGRWAAAGESRLESVFQFARNSARTEMARGRLSAGPGLVVAPHPVRL